MERKSVHKGAKAGTVKAELIDTAIAIVFTITLLIVMNALFPC